MNFLKEYGFYLRILQKKSFSFFIRLNVILLGCIIIASMNHLDQNIRFTFASFTKGTTSFIGNTTTTTLWGC
ncbi:hypothetical protein BWZ22_14190 [Seonamhaeicola sp. S2-3]|nr:hypothetical protein BWZ22_14190 [Seonamhaeicola sp. S2-3]